MTFKNYSHNVQSTVSEVKDNACTRGPSLSIKGFGPAAKYSTVHILHARKSSSLRESRSGADCSLTVTRTSDYSVSYHGAGICSSFQRVHPAVLWLSQFMQEGGGKGISPIVSVNYTHSSVPRLLRSSSCLLWQTQGK